MDQVSTKKMTPGDDMHLTLLMAPHNLNLVTGQDRQHLLAFGRAAFEAGQKCQGCSVPPNGLHQIAEASHSMSQYASKDDMLKAVMAENEQLRAQLAAAQQGAQPVFYAVLSKDGESMMHLHPAIAERDRAEHEKVGRTLLPLYAHPTPQGLDAQVQDRLDRLYLALEVCSAELFAQCAHQGRAMKYVDQARYALAAEQCARAAQAKQGGV